LSDECAANYAARPDPFFPAGLPGFPVYAACKQAHYFLTAALGGSHLEGDPAMQWTTPQFTDLRFGFEITMYIANR